MKIELKKINDRRYFPNNEMAIEIESKIIDQEIKDLEMLKDLVAGFYTSGKYVERLFELFDVSFDDDYSDILEFLNAKKGIIKTTIPYDNGEYRKNDDSTETWISRWTYLSYEVAHHDIDLDHVYTFEEVKTLVDDGKVVLLAGKPYKDVLYQYDYQQTSNEARKALSTIEDYSFDNIYVNSIQNNSVVIPMVISKYGTEALRNILSDMNQDLLSRLNALKSEAVSLEKFYSEKIYEYARFGLVCDSKIKKLMKIID